ncbi:MAG TPA: EF-hand domain-containing protein [Gemmataceae bacterium]|jgi:hypothetical protein|nr:EF-hand domain-containing protein [Gemmataceae bacterium]
MREHFDELDTDKDGKLSREELEKGAMTMAPRRRPSDVVYLLVETSDFDKEALPELQRMYDVLHRLDKNKDGKLDPQERKRSPGDQVPMVGRGRPRFKRYLPRHLQVSHGSFVNRMNDFSKSSRLRSRLSSVVRVLRSVPRSRGE